LKYRFYFGRRNAVPLMFDGVHRAVYKIKKVIFIFFHDVRGPVPEAPVNLHE